MIQCNNLVGRISAKESLKGRINNKEVQVYPELEDLEVTPSAEEQIFKSDKYGYDEVVVNGDDALKPENIKKDIEIFGVLGLMDGIDTSDADATASDIAKGKTAYVKGKKVVGVVETNDNNAFLDGGVLEGFSYTSTSNYTLNRALTKIDNLDVSTWESTAYLFYYCLNLVEVPELDTSNVTNMTNMFCECKKLKKIPKINTNNNTSFTGFASNCYELTEVSELNTSKATTTAGMFNGCKSLTNVPLLDTSNVTAMNNMFKGCSVLQSIPQFNTSKVENFGSTFSNCKALTDVPELDASSADYIQAMFDYCSALVNFGGLKNLGKAYI